MIKKPNYKVERACFGHGNGKECTEREGVCMFIAAVDKSISSSNNRQKRQ